MVVISNEEDDALFSLDLYGAPTAVFSTWYKTRRECLMFDSSWPYN